MIQVKVEQLVLSNIGFVVILKGESDERSLPIFIGAAEAQAIAIHLNKIEVPRPLTQDLLKNILDYLECRLKRIEICDLLEGTFYAVLVLEKDEQEMRMDARPSDAVALALRFQAPVYVEEKVMDEAGRVLDENTHPAGETGADKKKESPKAMKPEEVVQKNLEKAVSEERYEDAATLRDELRRIQDTHAKN